MDADDALRDALIEIVGARAVSRDEVAAQLIERDLLPGPPAAARAALDAAIQMDTTFSEVADGSIAHVPSLLEGTTWTTWVDPVDAEDDFVRSHPDLAVMSWWLVSEEVPLLAADGEQIGIAETDGLMIDGADTDVIIGPAGWLAELAGGWAAVAVVGGALRWSACSVPPEPTQRQIAAVQAAFQGAQPDRWSEATGRPAPPDNRFWVGEALLVGALLDDRSAFVEAPAPPVAELWRAAGLTESKSLVARADFDWDALHRWQRANGLRIRYGLGAEVDDVIDAVDVCITGELHLDEESARRFATALDHGPVAAAFWESVVVRGASPAQIGRFAEAVDSAASGLSRYGTCWLRSRAADAAGDVLAAADLLALVAVPGCDHGPLMLDAAAFAADRGDAVTAHRLLREVGVPEEPAESDDDFPGERSEAEMLMAEVRPWALNRPAPLARRNEPCPCGSGRKYKSCHLGRETHPLQQRAAWLYEKARRHLLSRHEDEIYDLAEIMAGDDDELTEELAALPLVHDIALHEDGVFDEFITARQALLPDDEALLATQWTLVDRGVFEITGFHRDALGLRNLATGERLTVVNVTPNPRLQVGTVFLGRPLPVGDTYRAFSGFIPLPFQFIGPMTDAVATGDASEVAEVLAALFAPPTVVDGNGEEIPWPEFDPDEPLPSRAPDDPELTAILADYVAQLERQWLDESIPALSGRTPRDAITDPVGREDVIRLLASLPVPREGEVGAMDPRRLRAALGL